MPALWKILIGLLLTLPVAAFATGRIIGPPDTTVDPRPVATSTESPCRTNDIPHCRAQYGQWVSMADRASVVTTLKLAGTKKR